MGYQCSVRTYASRTLLVALVLLTAVTAARITAANERPVPRDLSAPARAEYRHLPVQAAPIFATWAVTSPATAVR